MGYFHNYRMGIYSDNERFIFYLDVKPMKKYNPHLPPKKLKQQKYPGPKKKFEPIIPLRPSILNKNVNPDEIVDKINKWCDEAKNMKNGRK